MWEKHDENISNQNYVKLMNFVSKMEELDQIVLQTGLFASIKGHLCLTKGHLDHPEGHPEVESALIRSYFS